MRPSGRSTTPIKKKWTFKLRPGVKFHDGSPFNADAVVWNVEKVLKKDAPQFDASQVGVTASRMPTLVSARKIDDMTVELTTKEPDSFLPINLTNLFMASPAKWQKLHEAAEGADAKAKSQAAWDAFARRRVRHRPVEDVELHAARAARAREERQLLGQGARAASRPHGAAADAGSQCSHRRAACPGRSTGSKRRRPMRCPQIKQRGFIIYSNEEPHVWPWQFSRVEGSPWNDIRVRKAANLCIDREGLKDGLLGGLMVPATGTFEPGHPWRGNPTLPDQVRQAGCAETDAGGRLRSEQESVGQDPDLGVGFGPDACRCR